MPAMNRDRHGHLTHALYTNGEIDKVRRTLVREGRYSFQALDETLIAGARALRQREDDIDLCVRRAFQMSVLPDTAPLDHRLRIIERKGWDHWLPRRVLYQWRALQVERGFKALRWHQTKS